MINMARQDLRVQLEEAQVPIRYYFLYKFWEHYIYERMNHHKIIRWSAEFVVNTVIAPMHISCLIFWEKNGNA